MYSPQFQVTLFAPSGKFCFFFCQLLPISFNKTVFFKDWPKNPVVIFLKNKKQNTIKLSHVSTESQRDVKVVRTYLKCSMLLFSIESQGKTFRCWLDFPAVITNYICRHQRSDVWPLDLSQIANTTFPDEGTSQCLLLGKCVVL